MAVRKAGNRGRRRGSGIGLMFLTVPCATACFVAHPHTIPERDATERIATDLALPPPPFDKLSDTATAIASQRIKRIRQEIAHLPGHEWAGEYSQGGIGMNGAILLAPKSGFVYTDCDCMGLTDRNYGPVIASPSGLWLGLTFPVGREAGISGMSSRGARELIPVRWRKRHYLIDTDEIIDFCNDINSGMESGAKGSASLSHLLRTGDEKEAASGSPEIPPGYRPYLLAHPVSAQIVSVSPGQACNYEGRPNPERPLHDTMQALKAKFSHQSNLPDYVVVRAVLNAGSANGLRPGMTLWQQNAPAGSVGKATILTTEAQSCAAQIVYMPQSESAPLVDGKFSTRL